MSKYTRPEDTATETETETETEAETATVTDTASETATVTDTASETATETGSDVTDGRKPHPRKTRSQLPPLEERGRHLGLGRNPPPPAEKGTPDNIAAVRVPLTGSSPYHGAGDASISLPEAGGGFALKSEGHIISMPGEERQEPARKTVDTNRSSIEIAVYFMDKTGVTLQVENGQNMQAGELFERVMAQMTYPAAAREVFSLWLVSDLLELQLKPTHVPFKLACYWDELLEKYTDADAQDIERDEPVLMFQRNVFYPRKKEKELAIPDILRLLYCEARRNVLEARYPITLEQFDYLAGLQALIHYRTYDSDVHTEEHYKSLLSEYYPEHLCKTKWTFPGFGNKDPRESHIAEGHRRFYSQLGELEAADHLMKAYQTYLKVCWKLPYYGAAYFNGQIEHPGRHFFRNTNDDPVYVAINTDGVFIIDMDDTEFLLGLLYEELSWEYAEPKNRENRNCMPCLFLQFPDIDNAEKVFRVLQIFSRETVLMDALISSCIKLRKSGAVENDNSLDMADGKDDGIVRSDDKIWRKFNKLCLSTFNKRGECISNACTTKKR